MGPNLNQAFTSRGAEFIAKKIGNPSFNNAASAMPKFPLNEGDINSIVQYLKSVSQ